MDENKKQTDKNATVNGTTAKVTIEPSSKSENTAAGNDGKKLSTSKTTANISTESSKSTNVGTENSKSANGGTESSKSAIGGAESSNPTSADKTKKASVKTKTQMGGEQSTANSDGASKSTKSILTSAMSGASEMIKEQVNKIKATQIATAVALLVIGILFCVFRSSMLSVLLTLVGVVLILMGSFDIFKRRYTKGAIEIVIGIIIIACGWTVIDITLLLLGIVFIAYSVYSLIQSASNFNAENTTNKVLALLNPILLLIAGILLVVARWAFGDAICIVIGVVAIIDGIMILVRK